MAWAAGLGFTIYSYSTAVQAKKRLYSADLESTDQKKKARRGIPILGDHGLARVCADREARVRVGARRARAERRQRTRRGLVLGPTHIAEDGAGDCSRHTLRLTAVRRSAMAMPKLS